MAQSHTQFSNEKQPLLEKKSKELLKAENKVKEILEREEKQRLRDEEKRAKEQAKQLEKQAREQAKQLEKQAREQAKQLKEEEKRLKKQEAAALKNPPTTALNLQEPTVIESALSDNPLVINQQKLAKIQDDVNEETLPLSYEMKQQLFTDNEHPRE